MESKGRLNSLPNKIIFTGMKFFPKGRYEKPRGGRGRGRESLLFKGIWSFPLPLWPESWERNHRLLRRPRQTREACDRWVWKGPRGWGWGPAGELVCSSPHSCLAKLDACPPGSPTSCLLWSLGPFLRISPLPQPFLFFQSRTMWLPLCICFQSSHHLFQSNTCVVRGQVFNFPSPQKPEFYCLLLLLFHLLFGIGWSWTP